MDPDANKTAEEFGTPHEGLRAALPSILPEQRTRLQRQYLNRRRLAQWSHLPEGADIVLRFNNGTTVTFRLLSPPNMTAVRTTGGDGRVTWTRRVRNSNTDPPAPHDWTWYTQYLEENNLPIWFFQPNHLDMLDENAEGAILRLNRAFNPEDRGPENEPQVWFPDTTINEGRPYVFDFNRQDALLVAGNFPSALTQAEERREGYCTVVLPTGHIVIRPRMSVALESDVSGLLTKWLTHDEVLSITGSQAQSARASFAIGGDDVVPPHAPGDVRAQRVVAIEMELGEGSYVNPGEVLNGDGEWDFLTDDDRVHAASLALPTPQQVTEARARGLLPLGVGPDRRPVVVFRPDLRYFNPIDQPVGEGTWRYLSPSVEQLAHLNYGGNAELGLENTPRPTAGEIWTLRQMFTEHGEPGFAEEVDIIWNPVAPNDELESQSQQPLSVPTLPSHIDSAPVAGPPPSHDDEENLEGEIVPGPHGRNPGRVVVRNDRKLLIISPGPHNWQTVDWNPSGNPRAAVGMDQRSTIPKLVHYDQIRTPDGRLLFADRGAVRQDRGEAHKKWAWDNIRGQWKDYKPGNDPDWDWSKVESINGLNKWRDQSYTRWGWPHKRTERRDDYNEAENRWLWQRLSLKPNGRVQQDVKTSRLADTFEERFGYKRSEAALNSKMSRLKRMFRKNQTYKSSEGRGVHKRKQGDAQQIASSRQTEEDDEEYEEGYKDESPTQGEGSVREYDDEDEGEYGGDDGGIKQEEEGDVAEELEED
ncbi:hypothetical protein K431DRAFT_809 [Polychaeton citri CBS 116435]|uniref:Uncharacterized protein n=1 Tax=Polychaeton citri CBS 116435 TaxID=1314669 RepID=A0A9P4UVE5_9PEZI|nr:hypothetical protein K431DRAFT_809 [Polychaeton citri CBS 116435]